MVEESGAPVILVVRVRVDGEQKLSEFELVATRSRADGMTFAVDTYSGAPTHAMNIVPKLEQLETRERPSRLPCATHAAFSSAKTFNAVGTPETSFPMVSLDDLTSKPLEHSLKENPL
jgi:hypothetical protein